MLVVVVALASPAWAGGELIHLDYSAPSECPATADFRRSVLERAEGARLTTGAESVRVRQFSVRIWRSKQAVLGLLEIQEPDGSKSSRQVRGKSCEEVSAVLAFASALAIDPTAGMVSVPPDKQSAPASSKPEATGSPAGAGRIPVFSDPVVLPSLSRPWNLSLELEGELGLGVTPRLAYGAGVGIIGRRADDAVLLGLRASYLTTSAVRQAGAQATFSILAVSPWLCPIAGAASGLFWAGCLNADFGSIQAQGAGIDTAYQRRLLWAAVGPQVRVELALQGQWFLGMRGALNFPLTRYRYLFLEPETQVYQVPAVSGALGLMLGYTFE